MAIANPPLPGLRILDGGLGTELEARGCDLKDSLWSARALLESPELLESIHLDYLNAGADCITTASYQVSLLSFRKAGLSQKDVVQALRNSAAIARRACERFIESTAASTPLVAASVGPYGASLGDGAEFHGDYNCTRQELADFHSNRLEILAELKPDLLACETLPSLAEAEVILEVLQAIPNVKAWFSFTCRDGERTVHGEPISECARLLGKAPGVAAIGVNCTAPHLIAPLIEQIRPHTTKPIVVYPNAGQKWNATKRSWEGRRSRTNLGELAKQWHALGASWIGGCCGFGPEDIRAIRAAFGPTNPASY